MNTINDNPKFIVTWRSTAPRGVNYQTHKFSLLDALETASQFLGTDYVAQREQLLVGGEAYKIIKTLPQFIIKMPPPGAMMQKSDEQFGISTDYSVGVAGELCSRPVYWTNDPTCVKSARLINGGKWVTINFVTEDDDSTPVVTVREMVHSVR
jgi:hypothetical protein